MHEIEGPYSMDELFLSDINLGALLEVETTGGTFWVSRVRGLTVQGKQAFGFQITSGFGQSSHRGADNRIVRGKLWQWGHPGVLHGGMVSNFRFV